MRFVLVGNVTPAVAEAVVRHGHQVVAPDSFGITESDAGDQIIRAANKAQLDVITARPGIAEAPYQHDLRFHRSIVFLQLAGGDVEQDDAIDRLFNRYKRLVPKRLYTVTETRVKVRQLPG